jgi:hypothetical protein
MPLFIGVWYFSNDVFVHWCVVFLTPCLCSLLCVRQVLAPVASLGATPDDCLYAKQAAEMAHIDPTLELQTVFVPSNEALSRYAQM